MDVMIDLETFISKCFHNSRCSKTDVNKNNIFDELYIRLDVDEQIHKECR